MALVLLLMMAIGAKSISTDGEMALANITRFATGDLFSLVGTDCGVTRCMEMSHGTALAALGGSGCTCQCRRDTPTFREDRRLCVNHIDECPMASFGRGSTKPQIPFVFLPLKGQIIYPSKEIIFTDVEDSVCAVTSAQYLSPSGWVTLRDLVDNDVPFGLYRDEGSTYLQWKGSSALHARLEGRLVAAHVLCSAPPPARLGTSCAAFRIAGATQNGLLDVRSIPFHAGETVTTEPTTQSHGLSVLESLAIGVCVLMLVFIYAAGIIFYIHYKQKQKMKTKDPEMNDSNALSSENESTLDSRINMDSMRLKTNPLLDSMRNDYINDAGLSDVSEQTEDTLDSSPTNYYKERNSNIVSAVVHTKRKKPTRPTIRATSTPERLNDRLQRRSASPEMEKAPHSDVSILHCNIDNNVVDNIPRVTNEEPVIRRKLYFNPVFFETEHLKNPPPAAVDFLNKLREVMSIAKEKMTSKRFIPNLSDIAEEESYHTIDLGWDIPCARRGRRFSAISLKRENSRRQIHCGGCPGCDSSVRGKNSSGLMRSNSCKTCVSDDFKQKIVQKWLEDVPSPPSTTARPTKVAKVSGTPRVVEPKEKDDILLNPAEPLRNEDSETLVISESVLKELIYDSRVNSPIKDNEEAIPKVESEIDSNMYNPNYVHHEKRTALNHATRRVRKKLPPPPPPPDLTKTDDEPEPVLPEVKKKMEAVIRELNKCQRIEPDKLQDTNIVPDIAAPKIIIPVIAADSQYYSNDNTLADSHKKEFYIPRNIGIESDSLERAYIKERRFSLDFACDLSQQDDMPHQQILNKSRDRLSRSWRDLKYAIDNNFSSLQPMAVNTDTKNSLHTKDIFIHSIEPIYNNIDNPGPLTIEVRGSPIEKRKPENEDFDPDTLDRKPKKSTTETSEHKKSVEKILLKSGGSFKNKLNIPEKVKEKTPPEAAFTRKIGSLRQIYEAKNRAQESEMGSFYERRGSIPHDPQELAEYVKKIDLLRSNDQNEPRLPISQKLYSDMPSKNASIRNSPQSDRRQSSEERDRFPSRSENLNVRRSGRRSVRARTRRLDLKKSSRTEDSGYLSTDSNESKRRARYLMQLKPKHLTLDVIEKPVPLLNKGLQIESDTDELESLCDGRSESGGESVETDSVFFGNYNDSKIMCEELRLDEENRQKLTRSQEQIDSGFMGETNIILSGDSDSEHKSVISIVTGRDGRASIMSNSKEDQNYVQSVEF